MDKNEYKNNKSLLGFVVDENENIPNRLQC